jgi:hypothetical protein
MVPVDVKFVDETEVVDVDRDLRVVNLLERKDYIRVKWRQFAGFLSAENIPFRRAFRGLLAGPGDIFWIHGRIYRGVFSGKTWL